MDPLVGDLVDQAVLAIDPSRPSAGEFTAEGFGLADAIEWAAEHRFNQLECAEGPLTIGADPVCEIFEKRWVEDCFPSLGTCHSSTSPNCVRNS